MTKLDAYLRKARKRGVTAGQFAKRVGVSESYLSRLRRGLFEPSLSTAADIEKETGGEVPATSLRLPKKESAARVSA